MLQITRLAILALAAGALLTLLSGTQGGRDAQAERR